MVITSRPQLHTGKLLLLKMPLESAFKIETFLPPTMPLQRTNSTKEFVVMVSGLRPRLENKISESYDSGNFSFHLMTNLRRLPTL